MRTITKRKFSKGIDETNLSSWILQHYDGVFLRYSSLNFQYTSDFLQTYCLFFETKQLQHFSRICNFEKDAWIIQTSYSSTYFPSLSFSSHILPLSSETFFYIIALSPKFSVNHIVRGLSSILINSEWMSVLATNLNTSSQTQA